MLINPAIRASLIWALVCLLSCRLIVMFSEVALVAVDDDIYDEVATISSCLITTTGVE